MDGRRGSKRPTGGMSTAMSRSDPLSAAVSRGWQGRPSPRLARRHRGSWGSRSYKDLRGVLPRTSQVHAVSVASLIPLARGLVCGLAHFS